MNKDDFLDMKPAKHGVVSAVEKRSRRAPERRTHERVLADERARILSIMQLPEAADLGDIALYSHRDIDISFASAACACARGRRPRAVCFGVEIWVVGEAAGEFEAMRHTARVYGEAPLVTE